MRAPLVSIVLPTCNGARYIREAIDSCLAQTCVDWELVVVDDGSTDDTAAIVESFARNDARIRLVRHKHNCRLPAAVNTGFRHAKGRYFTWIADDNMYRPEALEVMIRFLEQHRDIGVVYTDATLIDEAGAVIRHRPCGLPDRMMIDPNPIGWCFMFPRMVWETVGEYDEDTFLAEDYDFWLRASCKFPFAALHQDLYFYRQQPDSLTQTWAKECRWAAAYTERKNLPRMKWPKRKDKALLYYEIASLALRRRRYVEMVDCLLRSFGNSPVYAMTRAGRMVLRKTVFRQRNARAARAASAAAAAAADMKSAENRHAGGI